MARKKTSCGQTVEFTLKADGASKVMLAGSFNNWNCTKTALKKGRGKVWQKSISLNPGKHEYKFVVDGNWINDPDNDNTVFNSLGTTNSVVEL